MSIVAEEYDYVIGVDCHAATHTFCVQNTMSGKIEDTSTFPVTGAGFARAHAWIERRTRHMAALVAIEGCGSYGATLVAYLADHGVDCVESPALPKRQRGGRGKSDPVDAERIASATRGLEISHLRRPREGTGWRKILQILVIARNQMTTERTRSINMLTDLVRTIDIGVDARRSLSADTIGKIARMRSRDEDAATAFARVEARRLACRIRQLDREVADNHTALRDIVCREHPELLELTGVGPMVAAQVLLTWSHRGRVRSEAAFASLAGTCPVPASSGNTVRHRLNRGGDRQLNRVVTTIVIVRMGRDERTRSYVQRRTAEGRGKKEIMRSLKRYVTRELYRTLQNGGATAGG